MDLTRVRPAKSMAARGALRVRLHGTSRGLAATFLFYRFRMPSRGDVALQPSDASNCARM
jgi:hypothetical protein